MTSHGRPRPPGGSRTPRPAVIQYRSADGCFGLQVAAILLVQPTHGQSAVLPGPRPEQPRKMTSTVPESAHSGLLGKSMNMMVSAPVPPGRAREDLMTRRQVASLFRVTSAAVTETNTEPAPATSPGTREADRSGTNRAGAPWTRTRFRPRRSGSRPPPPGGSGAAGPGRERAVVGAGWRPPERAEPAAIQNRSADGCLYLQVAEILLMQPTRAVSCLARAWARSSHAG